jgi:hypothetical protein
MEPLTAIDVLLEPEAPLRELALELNARLRRDVPWGFAFDATHQPHVTLLHRYVRAADLPRVFEAVDEVATGFATTDLVLRPSGISSGALGTPPGTALVSIEFATTPALRALHDALVDRLAPLARSGGDASAFFSPPGEPAANAATVAYVEAFVPAHSGERYAPHMSVGVGADGAAERLARDVASAVESRPSAMAVYQLGDLGTARAKLWSRF